MKCPRCDRDFESGFGVAVHWGRDHEGSPPDDLDCSMPEDSTSWPGGTLSRQLATDGETRRTIEENLRS